MTKRPILLSLLFWLVVALVNGGLFLRCGFGAGWDEASNMAINECRYQSDIWAGWINPLAILAYAIWAIVTIKRQAREDAG